MANNPVVNQLIDDWTYYDFKEAFGPGPKGMAYNPVLQPIRISGWVGKDNYRRLAAYKMLESYFQNAARLWLRHETDDEERRDRREYGDVNLLINQTMASLLGWDQSIWVDDIEDQEDSVSNQIHELLLEWLEDENFLVKLMDCERTAVKLGDGVYVLQWDAEKDRPRVWVYDPGFYFPVLDPRSMDKDYPEKVHIAWEFEEADPTPSDPNRVKTYVRRLTWFLAKMDTTVSYPWNDEPSDKGCFFSDGVWDLNGLGNDVDTLDESKATWTARDQFLEIDFIPVIHIPNLSGNEHFGVSFMANLMQLIDDLISTDTDLQKASATTGSPPLAVSDASLPTDESGQEITTYGPGQVFSVGQGNITVVDTSRSLDALIKLSDKLLDRLSTNGRTPAALLGRVKPNEVPSGIAITLSFSPHMSMIREMRMIRDTKYKLLFKFVLRFFLLADQIQEVRKVGLRFGSYLPADKQETSSMVQNLMSANAVSLETAVRMLVDAGFPIEDAMEEIDRINSQNYAAALKLFDATGDMQKVYDFLGLGQVPTETLPGQIDPETGQPIEPTPTPNPAATPPSQQNKPKA